MQLFLFKFVSDVIETLLNFCELFLISQMRALMETIFENRPGVRTNLQINNREKDNKKFDHTPIGFQ